MVDGQHWLLDFGSSEDNALRARDVIRYYGFDRQCFVGRPDPPMMYFTIGGAPPHGPMPGEDAVALDLRGVVAQELTGRWVVTAGTGRILDFGTNKANALPAVSTIKRYAFTHQCFVGRPNPPLMYFRT
jgi:hypothetical protein